MVVVYGQITDQEDQQPLPGAHVYHLDEDGSPSQYMPMTVTDSDGVFWFETEVGQIMEIHMIGYAPLTMIVDSDISFDPEGDMHQFLPFELSRTTENLGTANIVAFKELKPFWKKPWFFVLILLLVLGVTLWLAKKQ